MQHKKGIVIKCPDKRALQQNTNCFEINFTIINNGLHAKQKNYSGTRANSELLLGRMKTTTNKGNKEVANELHNCCNKVYKIKMHIK